MTLKQFLQLAGGIIFGIAIYASPIPFFFKYPLAILAIFLGVGMAFVPVGGRPMDQWLIAFIKSIYSPTVYIWKKQESKSKQPATPNPTNPQTQPKEQPYLPINSQNTTPSSKYPTATSTATNTAKTQPPAVSTRPQPQPQQTQPKPQATATLPIPATPTNPNTITGLTLDPQGHILEGAIIDIQKNNITIRATKSNKLGQFIFVQPLKNGNYTITTEKEGYSFTAYSLNLQGKIIPPLKLQAK